MEQRPIQEVQTDMLDHMPNYDEKKKKQQGANCQAIPEDLFYSPILHSFLLQPNSTE